MLSSTDKKLTSGANKTVVTVDNPSGDTKLTVQIQGQIPPKMERHNDYINDTQVGSVQPNGLGAIGGGQFDWRRRFVLIADRATTIEVTSRDSNFVVEELTLVNYADAGPCWDVSRELPPAQRGVKYQLDADTRVSIRINQSDESLDGAYVNLRQIGDADVRIVQQEIREIWRKSHSAVWIAPQIVGEVAPGGSRDFVVNDTSRLVVSTEGEREIALNFVNTNVSRTLRLLTVDAKGNENAVSNIGTPHVATNNPGEIYMRQLNYSGGRVVIRKGLSCIVQQQPQ